MTYPMSYVLFLMSHLFHPYDMCHIYALMALVYVWLLGLRVLKYLQFCLVSMYCLVSTCHFYAFLFYLRNLHT